MEGLGDRIRAFRADLNLSQTDLARAAKISKAYLSELEGGAGRRPSADVLLRIADALGVTIGDILGRSVSPEDPVDIPKELRELADEEDLTDDEVRRLAQIRLRGGAPRSKERWRFIYNAIRGSSGLDRER